MKKLFLCPICKIEVKPDEESFPFCCERCRIIDLGRWADGSYSIPDTESKPELEANEPYSIH